MNIIYIINEENINNSSGVLQKVNQQVHEWKKQQHNVIQVLNIAEIPINTVFDKFLPVKIQTLLRFIRRTVKLQEIISRINPDIIYSRVMLYSPYLRFLKHYNYIVELNGIDIDEYKIKSKPLHIYNLLTRSFFYKLPKRFIAVSYELKEFYSSFLKPTEVISNASPNNLPGYEVPNEPLPERIVIGMIGSEECPWQGVDKFIKLANEVPEYNFEIIGKVKSPTPNNIKVHGPKDLESSCLIIKSWTVAISSLSFHVKNMYEASPLKSRLYLALQMPYIYAYRDTDGFIEDTLQIPNTKLNIQQNLDKIKRFTEYYRHNKCQRNHYIYSFEFKEKKRLEYFNKLIHSE